MKKIHITEYLDIDLDKEMWYCNRCSGELISTDESYMKGCLVHDREATEIYGKPIKVGCKQEVKYAPDKNFNHILEFYCPHCGTMLEVQYLPPGHPIPVDIALDIKKLKSQYLEVHNE